MPKFELTARSTMNLGIGMQIPKGERIEINIPMMGIVPGNLFGNPRCRDAVQKQFELNGLSLPPNSPFLNRGHWDVKMLPF